MTILANGQVATTKSTIFEANDPSSSGDGEVKIEKISFFNTNSTQQTAILFIKKRNSTSIKLRQFVLLENEGGEYLEPGESLPLDNGDIIEAQTTTASAVDFIVFGTTA